MQSIERRVHVPGGLLVPSPFQVGTANFQNGVVEGGGPEQLGGVHEAKSNPTT